MHSYAIVWWCFNQFHRDNTRGKKLVDAKNLLKEAISKGPHFDAAFYLNNLESLDETNVDTA